MSNNLKRFLISCAILISFLGVQITESSFLVAKAQDNFSVEVVVDGYSEVMASGTSSKSNAMDALKEVLQSKNISLEVPDSSYGGKYISAIGGLKEKHFGKSDGWMYAVYSNGVYNMPFTSIDATPLKNGDRLVVYYGDFSVTLLPNKVEVAQTTQGNGTTISLSNSYNDYTTGKEVVTPINLKSAQLDGKTVTVAGGKITLSESLKEGNHQLYLSDFKENACPNVVAGTIDINVAKPASANSSQGANGNADNRNVNKDIAANINETAAFMGKLPVTAWSAVSLNKLAIKPDESFIKDSAQDIKKNGVKDLSNTDIEKLIIGLTACGYSSYKFSGYNLPEELFNRNINDFMINDSIFGLIAYKYAGINGNYKITPETLKDSILSKKIATKFDGQDVIGWSYMGSSIDPDLTGIAIDSLSAFYKNDPNVKSVVDNAVSGLSRMQNASGYIPGPYGISSESLSFVILGLTSIGINPSGSSFTKEKGDLVSAMLSFKGSNGGFKHSLDGENDNIATEEALRALIALNEFNKQGIYDYYGKIPSTSSLKYYNDETANEKVLPKTGSPFDTATLVVIGLIVALSGGVMTLKKN